MKMGVPFRYVVLFSSCVLASRAAFDYCTLYGGHTMCGSSSEGAACQGTLTEQVPDPASVNVVLNWHNDVRRKAALGGENQTAGGSLPSAKNMMKMMWDPELAAIAQRHVNQCVYSHDCYPCKTPQNSRFLVGQNLGIRYGPAAALPATLGWIPTIESWYTDEVALFSNQNVNSFVFGAAWGHYSQLIWWNTRSVGCGGAIYKIDETTYHYVACNYGTAANIKDKMVYKSGDQCSDCPANYNECDNGLCTAPAGSSFDVGAPLSGVDNVFL